MHSFVKAIKMWRRHVEVSHGESPLLVLTMQHQTKVKWRYTAMPLWSCFEVFFQDLGRKCVNCHTDVEALVGGNKFSIVETGMGVTLRP